MRKKTILVTGAEGMVGSYVPIVFKDDSYVLVLAGRSMIDVTDKRQVTRQIKKHKPHMVIHLAAKTNVDLCEKNPEETYTVNFKGTKNIADICKKLGIILVYVSTSAVFNGEKKGFSEKDIPNPVNIYGKSKLKGEEYIKKNLKKYYIVRAGWMIGGGKKEKKFVSYIIEQANKNMELKVVNDKFGTITYAKELIEFLKKLTEEKYPYGIYHYGSKGICSRFDMAKKILKVIKKDLKVIPVTSSEFAATFFAPRPHHEVIMSEKLSFPNTWSKSLKNYLVHEII